MTTQADVKSYENRIENEKQYAEAYLLGGDYAKLLTSAGRLLKLAGGLEETLYQLSLQDK